MFKLYTSIKNSFFESNYRRKNTFFNLFYILFSILQNKLIFSCKDQSKLEFVEKFPLILQLKNHLSFNVFKQNIDTVVVFDIDSLNYKSHGVDERKRKESVSNLYIV